MYSWWNDKESMLELKSRHTCCNNELESMTEELLGEIGMHQETANVLSQLLAEAYKERDEARAQLKKSMAEISELKKLLNEILPSNSVETCSVVSHIQADNRNKDDSSTGNGISGKLLNDASLIDSSNLALLKRPFVQDSIGRTQMGKFSSKDLALDHASKVIDTLVNGKPLPEKGSFLEAVLDTEPLLETIMITGQLPKWRNPPPLPSNFLGNHDHSIVKLSIESGFHVKTS